ncbi:MFS transporter [Sphingomonas sp. M6A6_1c]
MKIGKTWGWLLLVTIVLSTIGDEISLITLMFRTASDRNTAAVPMLLVAQLLPGLLAAPVIGRLVDAYDAARLLVVTAAADATIIAWMAWHPDLASTIGGAGILSMTFATGGAASFALIPVVAGGVGMTLSRANAVVEFVRSVGMLAGPVAGGVLVARSGAGNALLIDAASFALLAIVALASGIRRPAMTTQAGGTKALLSDYWQVLSNRRIGVVAAALAMGVYAAAIADVNFIFLVTGSLSAGPTAFGLLTACWAGGMMAGAAASGAFAMRHLAALAFGAAAMMDGMILAIGIACLTETGDLVFVGSAFGIGGAANSVHNVAVRTILQNEAPAGAHGKVAAIYGAATSSASTLGYMTGGLFVPDRVIAAYVVSGVLEIMAGLTGWLLFAAFGRRAPTVR